MAIVDFAKVFRQQSTKNIAPTNGHKAQHSLLNIRIIWATCNFTHNDFAVTSPIMRTQSDGSAILIGCLRHALLPKQQLLIKQLNKTVD